jgi:ATP-dependent Clp protease ATP-binding subunit ClpC
VFERFTERARQVVVLAQAEARALNHNYIGTEHLLLGLLRKEEGVGAKVLESLGVTLEEVRAQVARIVGHGEEVASGTIPFTPRAKRVLELSLQEALRLGHNHIGTEHLLLGLARENQGVASRILLDFGVDDEKIRDEVVRILSGRSTGLATAGAPEAERRLREGLESSEAVESPRRFRPLPIPGRKPRRVAGLAAPTPLTPLLVAAAGFPLGLLVGWLIWS